MLIVVSYQCVVLALTIPLLMHFMQVTQATSFIYHLISIQQDQRYVVYRASDQLENLRQLLNGIGTLANGLHDHNVTCLGIFTNSFFCRNRQ